MPRFDWNNTQAVTGGSGSGFTIPNGGYVCKILSAEWGKSNSGYDRLKLMWDVAEGEHANCATNGGWYESKHTDYISFAPNMLGRAKGKLQAFAASNGNWDPFSAIERDAFQEFVGRYVGMVLKLEVGEWNGKQTKKMIVDNYKSVEDIRAGRFVVPVTEEPVEAPVPPAPVPSTYAAPQQMNVYGSNPNDAIPF